MPMRGSILIAALMALTSMPAAAQEWPNKPVQFITPAAAGNSPDVVTRIVADKLSQMWKQQIVVLGGFAETGPNGLTVLADMAASLEDLDRAVLKAQIRESEERIKTLEQGSLLDREIARLDHLKALDGHMTGTAMH